MVLASVRFLCQGLSTMPKCSTRSKDLPRLCSYNVSLMVSGFIHLLVPCGPPWSRWHPLCIELTCSSSLGVQHTCICVFHIYWWTVSKCGAQISCLPHVCAWHGLLPFSYQDEGKWKLLFGKRSHDILTKAHKGNPQRTETRQTLDCIHGEELRPKSLHFICTQGPHVLHQPESEGPNRGPRVLKPEVYGSCLHF